MLATQKSPVKKNKYFSPANRQFGGLKYLFFYEAYHVEIFNFFPPLRHHDKQQQQQQQQRQQQPSVQAEYSPRVTATQTKQHSKAHNIIARDKSSFGNTTAPDNNQTHATTEWTTTLEEEALCTQYSTHKIVTVSSLFSIHSLEWEAVKSSLCCCVVVLLCCRVLCFFSGWPSKNSRQNCAGKPASQPTRQDCVWQACKLSVCLSAWILTVCMSILLLHFECLYVSQSDWISTVRMSILSFLVSVCLYVCLIVILGVCMSVCWSFWPSVCLSVCIIWVSVCQSTSAFERLSVCHLVMWGGAWHHHGIARHHDWDEWHHHQKNGIIMGEIAMKRGKSVIITLQSIMITEIFLWTRKSSHLLHVLLVLHCW